jgi:macrodomain Ter protein organizer (MatP/YcbG family)
MKKSESSPFGGPGERRSRFMKAKELDKKFDDGEDITKFFDLSRAKRPGREQRRVNVDFLAWMIERLDKEARRLGVTRQSIIKVWIADRLQKDVP